MSEESQCHTAVTSDHHHDYRHGRARRESDHGTITASQLEKKEAFHAEPVFDTGLDAWLTVLGT